ncbi:MAG: FAD-dependent oxidoreductase, partial [Desulfobaccales bacterium]
MTRSHVLICTCPDLAVDAQELARRLAQQGVEAHLAKPLCTPAGIEEWGARLKAAAPDWLVAACGPARHHGLFQHLAGSGPLAVVNLLENKDLESVVAAILLGREEEPSPAPAVEIYHQAVLVVGGGVGGCQAALDLANAGIKVYLVESSLSIGGTMAQLDKTFPTLDCSICI